MGGPGGASVHPETALTQSLGFDIDAGRFVSALNGLEAHVTYWQAKFIGAITSPLSTQDVQIPALANNLVINPSDAQIAAAFNSGRQILSVPSGPITFLQYYVQQNAFNLYANGLDFAASYRWDMGAFETEEDAGVAWRRGALRFRLEGRRLRGRWRIFRMKGREQEGRPLWLLQKVEDEFAVAGHEAEVIEDDERPKPPKRPKTSSKKTAKQKKTATKKRAGKKRATKDD